MNKHKDYIVLLYVNLNPRLHFLACIDKNIKSPAVENCLYFVSTFGFVSQEDSLKGKSPNSNKCDDELRTEQDSQKEKIDKEDVKERIYELKKQVCTFPPSKCCVNQTKG